MEGSAFVLELESKRPEHLIPGVSLMSLVSKATKRSMQYFGAFLGSPRICLNLIRTLPFTERGVVLSRMWKPASNRPSVVEGETAVLQTDAANPLQAYFDSIDIGPGVNKWNHYFDIYHHHLSRFIGREVDLVEIGVQSGGSLRMWSQYFGPGCRIFGVDIDPNCKSFDDERTKIYIGDQEDRSFWRRFKGEVPAVDIVIDDGGHNADQQMVTLEELLPHIRPGGVYICEDIHGVYNRFSAYIHGVADHLNAADWLPKHLHPGESIGVRATAFQSTIKSIHLYVFVAVVELADRPTTRFAARARGTQWIPFMQGSKPKSAATDGH
jgi:hypothetical protein